jgi:uncharacterized glyoxalase superfamily protein PhnB
MIRQIAPLFFTMDIPATLAYYKDKLGFECLGTWQDPPVYAIVARDRHAIHFRCAEPPIANPDKYSDELLDAYIFVEDADALYTEYAARGVEFTRKLANMPWKSREFVVKDCDGRLLASARTCNPRPGSVASTVCSRARKRSSLARLSTARRVRLPRPCR